MVRRRAKRATILIGPPPSAGRAGKPEGEKLLLDLLAQKTTPPIVRATAIELLGNYSSTASIAARRDALHDTDPQIRLSAIRVLPSDNVALLTANLASMLSDRYRAVRVAAVAQLTHLPLDNLTDRQREDFEKAMIEYRESEKLSLDHAGAHLSLAAADRRHNRIQEAIGHLTKAIALEPYLTGARGELASIMQEYGGQPAEIERLRKEEADLLDRDAKLAPENANIFYRLGLMRYLLGEFDKAGAAFQQACEKAPQNYDYRMVLALLQKKRYEDTGDVAQHNEAMKSLAILLKLNRDDPRAKQIYLELDAARKHARSEYNKEGGRAAATVGGQTVGGVFHADGSPTPKRHAIIATTTSVRFAGCVAAFEGRPGSESIATIVPPAFPLPLSPCLPCSPIRSPSCASSRAHFWPAVRPASSRSASRWAWSSAYCPKRT